jgi:MarR family transcriptional regulator, lower aerobic nicotinate degradation pathway regulator
MRVAPCNISGKDLTFRSVPNSYGSAPNERGVLSDSNHTSAGAWAKRYHLASRAMIERILRPYDLGSTQWYVLYQLANQGPTPQRDFPKLLQIEKPALSDVVAALVRKGFVDQAPDPKDQRQRILSLTDSGRTLWDELPDPIALILQIAFEGVDEETLKMVASILQAATERLNNHIIEGVEK